MRRKTVLFVIIYLAYLIAVGCGKLTGPSPKEVLSRYLDATLKGRYEEAYSYLSKKDKVVKDLQSYLNEHKNDNNLFTQAIASKMSYRIKKIEESDRNATADVEITLPDFGSIFTDIMGAAFKSAFGGGDEKEIEKILAKKLESGEVPVTTEEETFRLVKEEEGWKVFLDWEAEKIKKGRHAKIQGLLAEAVELKKSKKFYGAVEKYEQILELDSEMVDAKEGLEETKKEIESFEEKQSYIKNVELYDLKAKYYKTYLEENVVNGHPNRATHGHLNGAISD
jgi:hypothetical protein